MPQLTLHPNSRCAAVIGIEAEATRPDPDLLMLRYVLRGSLGDVRLPPVTASARADGLWRHTCFEAFVGIPGYDGYFEFNFAPSTEWAAHRFDRYREGMRQADGIAAPRIEVLRSDDSFELRALVDLGRIPGLSEADWRVGPSTVVEETGGGLSYWALTHPTGKPDFHHPDCFALELPGSGRP